MVLTTADVKKYAISIQKSIKDPRKRALKQLEIAKRYREANNLEEAQECAKEYLKVNPSDHRAYNTLGLINEDLKQWEDALKCYKRSVELQRTQKDILIKVVEMYSKVPLKEPQIAKVWADKAEVISPNHPAIFNLRWHLLMSTSNKDYEEIEDLLAHELVRNPRDAKLHVKLLELYMEKDDMEEAYTHCKSVLSSRVFQSDQDWLMCAADVFEKYHQISNDDVEAAESFMKYVEVLCSLMDILLKTSSVYVVKDIFQRLDKVIGEAYIMPATSLPEHVQSEIEVFQAEARGQMYFHLSTVLFKMAQESELSWRNASRLACACLAASSLVKKPNTKVAWMQKKSPPDNIKMNWHTMACVRLSQTDHMILSMENEQSEEWIQGCVTDICSEAGKQDLIKAIYEESRPSSKSFLSMDKEFMTLEFELPDVNDVLKYDEVAFKENPNNLSLLVWVGINWHIMDDYLRTEVLGLYGQLFRELQPDVKDLKNCSPFYLSTMDLEVFIQAVVYSAVDKVTFDDKENKEEFEPLLLPLAISPKLDTNTQFDLWDSAYRLHTGKTWQASTSKLKSVLQHGLEVLRLIGNHGIDPRILKHIADLLLSKASDIIDNRPNEWRNQIQLESLKRRGFYFGDEALRILEISKSDRDVVQPKGPLIPPLLETIDDDERTELIDNLRMTLADAAFQDNSHDAALHYLSGVFTADSAYKEAQIYRDLASKENHTNVEGLRNHLSFLRKSREKLQTCLGLLEKSQAAFRTGIEAEIEEIREAISEQSGITAAPSKLLELRYSSAEEEEDEPENIIDVDQIQDESVIESKLALENSILHEQLAVRNHEFSVLASRIHNLEREMAEMRANQSASESIIKPRQDSSVNTDESSSSIAYVPKDDITSGSGNLTPRLEPEMSWDPFSPAPVAPAFPANFFAGLVDTAHTIAEETEHELLEANDSVDAKVEGSSAAVDTSQGEGGHSREEADHSHGDGIHVEPVVFLTKKADHTTGEENETVMFKEKAKLYRLNEGQWKERGVGEIKILMNPKTSKSRLLMRREQVFRLCANHLITQEMKMEQKQDSGKTFIWYTNADMSEEAPTAETFAVKFKNEQIAGAFASKFKECQEALKTPNDTKEEPEVAALSSRDETKPPSQSTKIDAHVTSDVESINPLLKASSLQQPTQEAPTFSFKLGGDAAAKPDDGEKLASTFAATTAQQTEGIQPAKSTVKFDFNPQATSGFPFGASKLNFDFGSVAHQPPEDDKAKENPFIAALKNKSTSSNIVNPFSFTSPGDSSQSAQDLPSFGLQGSPFASTPVLPSSFQIPNANRSLATAPQNARPFMAVASFSPQQFPNFSPQQLPNFSSQQLPNISSQRLPNFSSQQQLQTRMGSPNAMHNAALHGPNMGYDQSQGYGLNNQLSNQNMEQARYFQEADWEERQDRYYEDAAYDDNDYYDDSTYYENGDYYDDGEFYTAEDGNSDQEAAAYYANEEDEFEYYDQEPTGPQIATADSDANSDRLSPQNEAVDSADIVPHVVQMIDDDIFVTYVKKATFAQRAKAARLQLPPNFFAPSSHPPCAGCQGCEDNTRVVIPADSPERSTATSESKIPDAKMDIAVAKTDQIPVFPVVSKDRGQAEDKNPFLSFSDIVSNKSSQGFQGTPKGFAGFAGAGAQLFSSPKDNEDPEAYDPQYKPIIELEKKDDLKTGEEGYVDLFKSRAKLYRFDHEGKQWKERGVGEMKLSHNPETSYCRVLMRRDQVRKLCANHPTMPNIRLKPHGLSTTSWIWVSGADYADGEPKVEQFAIKFKNKELADEFKRVFEECQRTIVTYLQANGLSNEGEALKGDIEPKRVASKPGNPMQGGTVEATRKDDTTTDQQVAFPPANSQATDKKESNESIKVSKDSIRLKFAPAVGSWECPTCMIVNKEAVMQCVSCTTAKPGTDPKPKSAPLFGQPTAKQGTDPEPKGAPLFGQSTGNASLFGQQSNKTQMFGQAASSGFVFGKSNSASPFAGFSLTPKNAEESGTKEKTVEGAGKQESSIRLKFAPETGSWECDVCMVVNKPEVSECVACCTAKPGSDPKPSKPPFFGQKPSNEPLFGNQPNSAQVFGQAPGSGFMFGKTSSNSPFVGFSLKPKNEDKSVDPTKENTTQSTPGLNAESKTSSAEFSKTEPNEKVAGMKAPLFGQNNKNGFQFGTPSGSSAGGLFGSSAASFAQPAFSTPSFGLGLLSNDKKDTKANGSGSWECPTCLISNNPKSECCRSCKTENPTFLKDKTSPIIALKRSPLAENTDIKSMFAPKPGSWECPFCAIVNNKETLCCPACTTERPDSGQNINNKDSPAITSKPLFNFKQSELDSSLPKPFIFGQSSQDSKTTDFSFYATPTDTRQSQGGHNETTQFFTPTGTFSPAPFSFGKQPPSDVPPQKSQDGPQTPESPTKADDHSLHFDPLVSLKKIDVHKTGEENEEAMFCGKAKLYRFDGETKAWKERGVGELKILRNLEKAGRYRLVMRREQIRKLCANHSLVKGMSLKPMANSEKARIWSTAADYAEEETRGETFAVRFRTLELVKKFELMFNEGISENEKVEGNEGVIGQGKQETTSVSGSAFKIVDEENTQATESQLGKENEEKIIEAEKETYDIKFTKEILPSVNDQNKAEKLLLPKEFFNILSQGKEEQNAKESVSSSAPKVGAFSFNPKPVIFETFVTPRAPASEDSAAVQSPKAPASPEKFKEEECKATFTPIVQLERKEAGTGEESEGILFCQKAKVYRFDKNGPQWKERGVGQLKILKNKENGSVRIVMRRDQVKKICLNHFILPDMKLSPFENAKNAVIWFTPADFADESPQEEKFAAKFKSEEICKQFKDCFDSIANVGNGDHAKGDETATNSSDKVEDIGSSLVSNADQDTTVTSSVPSSNSQDVLPKQTPPSSGKGSQPLFSFGSTIASSRADTTVEDSTRSAQSKEGFGQFSWPVKLDSDKGLFSFGAADATLNDSKIGDKVQGTGTETSQPTKDSGLFSWPVNLQGSNNALSFGVSETNKEQDTSLTSIAESQQQIPEFTTKVDASKPFSFMWTDKEAIKGPFSFFSSGKAVEEIDGEAHQKEQTQDSASSFGLNAMQGSERVTSSSDVDSKSSKGIEEVKKERDEETAESPARQPEDDECKAEFKALVSLNEVSHISGEENEEVLFNETAKAYRLDNDVKQWKERGKGDLKILKNRQSGQHRIIMRREQVKKIIINHAFIADMELKPFASKKNSWVWSTHADFADEVPKPEHLCVRFRNQEISDRFQTMFDGIIWMMNCEPEAVSVPESDTKEGDSGVHLDSQSLINAGLTATSSQIGVEELVPSTDSQETPAVEAHVPKDIEQSPVQRKSEVSSVSKVNEDVSVSTNDDSIEDDVLITFIKEPLEVEREKASRLLLPLTFYAASNEIPHRHRDSTPSPTAAMNENKDLQVEIEKEKNIDTNTSHFGFASSNNTGLSFSDLLSNTGGDFTAFKSSPQQTFKGQGAALFQSPNEKDGNDDYEAQVNFKPIVSLAKTEIKTGEEDEIALFTSRCKLYRLDGQWKERGVGELKILNNTNQGTFRIIMRRDVVRKLGANHLLHPGMEVVPKEGVETTWIWKCSADIADGEPHAQTFAAKFKNATIGRSFKESFEQGVRDSGQQVNAGSDHQKVEEETSATPTENIYEVPGNSSQFLEGSFVQGKEEVQSDQTGIISNDKASDQAAAAEPKLFGSSYSGLNFSNIATTGENAFKNNQRGGFANAGAQLFRGATGEGGEGREHDPHFEPIVQLQQVEVKSGEEDEDVLFAERAKMYRLHKESNAWKERGVGVLKLLRHKVTGKSRLLMRRDIIHKLAANHALTEDMKLEKMELSQRSLMWRTMAEMSDGEPEEALLAAKFRSEDMVSQFREVFEFLCSQKELIDKKVSDEVDEMPHRLVGSCSPAISDALQNFLDDKET